MKAPAQKHYRQIVNRIEQNFGLDARIENRGPRNSHGMLVVTVPGTGRELGRWSVSCSPKNADYTIKNAVNDVKKMLKEKGIDHA